MRITILTTSFPEYSGDVAGAFVAHFAEALVRESFKVCVIAPHSPNTPKHEVLSVGSNGEVSIQRFQYIYPVEWQRVAYGNGLFENLRSSFIAKLGFIPFLLIFWKKIWQYKQETDVYHAQWILSGLLAFAGQWIHRKPIILTLRGSDLLFIQGKFFKGIVRHLFKKMAMITTVSDTLRNSALGFGIPEKKIFTVPNGINCDVFRPRPKKESRQSLGLPQNQKIVLWIGRFVEIKGIEYLVQAIPDVLAAERDVLFVLVGGGKLLDAMKQQVQDLDIAMSVMFAGKVLAQEVPLWMSATDVFVLPSLSEGRPNVLLEAMASEIPVVATEVGGIPELVQHAVNGFLVPSKDVLALTDRILELLKNPILCQEMGKAGRRRIFDMELSWEQCAQRMKMLYQQVVT